MVDTERAGEGGTGRLVVDLGAVVANYRRLVAHAQPARCAAVVKADAYGTGAAKVAPALAGAGCRWFFIATFDEAIALRPLLPPDARLLVLNGVAPSRLRDAAEAGIVPVVNDLDSLACWRERADGSDAGLPLCLQTDSGMSRLGMSAAELARLTAAGPSALGRLRPLLLMSHLACADAPDHPRNAIQLEAFQAQRAALAPLLGDVPASLSASSGIFLGEEYRFDLVRPGAALFGITPARGQTMASVVRLTAPCVQLREIGPGEPVGYGATFVATRTMRIATIGAGYADGFLRAGSNRGAVHWAGVTLPIVGLVSMDSITVDASDPTASGLRCGDAVELIGPGRPVDRVARDAGTIGYEMLTALGRRYDRRWI